MTNFRSRLRRLPAFWLATAAACGSPGLSWAQAGPPGPEQLVQWTVEAGGNGHWYRYVPTISIFTSFSFDFARAAALASTQDGLTGYLATVTSAEEQSFINGAFSYLLGFGASGLTWLGASDAVVEGQWRWLDGPEAGQPLGFTDWRPGQPSDGPGFEDHDLLALSILATSPPADFGWVSLTPANGALGYIVEYGEGSMPPVPEPAAGAMLAAGLAALGWAARRRRPG